MKSIAGRYMKYFKIIFKSLTKYYCYLLYTLLATTFETKNKFWLHEDKNYIETMNIFYCILSINLYLYHILYYSSFYTKYIATISCLKYPERLHKISQNTLQYIIGGKFVKSLTNLKKNFFLGLPRQLSDKTLS